MDVFYFNIAETLLHTGRLPSRSLSVLIWLNEINTIGRDVSLKCLVGNFKSSLSFIYVTVVNFYMPNLDFIFDHLNPIPALDEDFSWITLTLRRLRYTQMSPSHLQMSSSMQSARTHIFSFLRTSCKSVLFHPPFPTVFHSKWLPFVKWSPNFMNCNGGSNF